VIQLRDARAADAATVVGWFRDHDAARSWGGPTVPDPLTAAWLSNEMEARGYLYRSACDDGRLIGFYGLFLPSDKARAHVVRVVSSPAYRRRGVGAALLQDAVAIAKGRGVSRLTLFVYGSNGPARLLYERLGWRHAETAPAPEDASGFRDLMELEIGLQ
jgi:ribosomal-protein-alanine N-acetyltransferase